MENPNQSDYGYSEFYSSIDTTLMGNKTYQKILDLGVELPYKGKKAIDNSSFVEFISQNPVDFVNELKTQHGTNIWLIGGGGINTILLNHSLIDQMIVTIFLIILGQGIPLFKKATEFLFVLNRSQTFASGLVQLVLDKKI